MKRCKHPASAKALGMSNDSVRTETELAYKPALDALFGRKPELADEFTLKNLLRDPRMWFRVGGETDSLEAVSGKKPRLQHRATGRKCSNRAVIDVSAKQ